MRRILIILLSLSGFFSVKAQNNANYIELARIESQLKSMFDELYSEEITGLNMKLYLEIDSLFGKALELEGSYDYAWSKLDMIGKLKSDDGQLKVFSWLYMQDRNQYHYTCYAQLRNRKEKVEVYIFKEGSAEDIKSEDYPQKPDDWHGKIYYELLTNIHKRNTFYTLIGADFNTTESTIKTIEVLTIHKNKPRFSEDQFLEDGKVRDRVVLEYSSDLAVSVRFNKELDMIVFDHLAPLHPLYHGNYQFYGPDGSYDAYKFIDGIWVMESDVDARNK